MVKWILIGFSSFILMIVMTISFVFIIMPQPKPRTAVPIAQQKSALQRRIDQMHEGLTSMEIEQIKIDVDSLYSLVDRYQKQIKTRDTLIDSLKKKIESLKGSELQKQEEIDKLLAAADEKTNKENNARDMAKTLSSMKTKQLAPILKNLDDETLLRIYNQLKGSSRKDLLLALDDKRAAQLTKRLIN